MEVVINDCYGGFGLSPQAERLLAKLQGKQLFFYKQVRFNWEGGAEYKRVDDDSEDVFLRFALTKDLGSIVNNLPSDSDAWFNSREIKRDDSNLIKVVKELGKKANDSCSDLKIIEIPDGIDYTIEEYDGMEWVAEKHRTWE